MKPKTFSMPDSFYKDVSCLLTSLGHGIKKHYQLEKLLAITMTAAHCKTTIPYDVAGQLVGVFSGSEQFSNMLGRLVDYCVDNDMPLFSACIKGNSKETSSDGFFTAVENCRKENPHLLTEYTTLTKKEFWEYQFKKCCDYFKK